MAFQTRTASELISLPMLEKLVSFPSVSRDGNVDLIDFVKSYLTDLGAVCHVVWREEGKKANLFATLGPVDKPGVMLSGHTDVVPVDGQSWTSDPFKLAEREGKLFGRGACDMKGFLAVALAFAPEFLKGGLKTPIHYALSCDEEVGCVGVIPLVEAIKDWAVRPAMGIIGEPTSMNVVLAHKGKKFVRAHVKGKECHSSIAPTGVNAVEYGAEVIAFVRAQGQRLAKGGPYDYGYDMPHTTAHVGVVYGGTALNIVPADCWFDFEYRHLPQDDPDELLGEVKSFAAEKLEPDMHAVAPDTGFEWEEISSMPGLNTPDDADVVRLATELAETGAAQKVAYGTEAGRFSTVAGIPCVVCGPGDIAQAHKPDEFITVDQMAKGEAFMRRLVDKVSRE